MTNNASINTLSEFLMQAQTQYLVFDLGRGIQKIDNQMFFEWENQQAPCAYPRQDHAWFCIVFWNEKLSEERYIWFIKLPLEERGFINQAARNQFLEIIVTALGKELEHTSNTQAQLPENPYVFQPSQQQLADCNAHIRYILSIQSSSNQAASIKNVMAYLKAPNLQQNENLWTEFSLQNISDIVINPVHLDLVTSNSRANEVIGQSRNICQTTIADNIHLYPTPLSNCIFASLESVEVSEYLTSKLITLHKTIEEKNTAALCLRALSYKPNKMTKQYIASLIIDGNKLDLETCVVIAGRFWNTLKDKQLLAQFMHQIADLDHEFLLFRSIYSDLVRVPEVREELLQFIRSTERTELVSKAIGSLFQQ